MRSREVTVTKGGLVERALCGPTLHRQPDLWKAERSRWMYRIDDEQKAHDSPHSGYSTPSQG